MLKELENHVLLWAKPVIEYLIEAVIFEVKLIQNKYQMKRAMRTNE